MHPIDNDLKILFSFIKYEVEGRGIFALHLMHLQNCDENTKTLLKRFRVIFLLRVVQGV